MEFFNFSEFACRCCGRIPPGVRGNIEALVDNVLDPARRVSAGRCRSTADTAARSIMRRWAV